MLQKLPHAHAVERGHSPPHREMQFCQTNKKIKKGSLIKIISQLNGKFNSFFRLSSIYFKTDTIRATSSLPVATAIQPRVPACRTMHLCITMDQFYDDVTYPKSARTHFRAILCLLRPRWTPLQLGKNNKNRIAQEKKNTRKVKYKSSQFNALSGCVCARTYIVCLIIILPPKK